MNTPAPVLSYRAELARKALHLGALILPLGLLLLGRETALLFLAPLAVLGVGLDIARQRIPAVRRVIHRMFTFLMRPEEQPALGDPLVLNGAVWMCVSAALCALLFREPIAAAALIMLMIGDGAAAVIGRRYGRHRYAFSTKSVEGSLAFFVTALVAAMPLLVVPLSYPSLTPLQLINGAFIAALAEALPLPLNDNIRVPILTGFVMTLLGGVG